MNRLYLVSLPLVILATFLGRAINRRLNRTASCVMCTAVSFSLESSYCCRPRRVMAVISKRLCHLQIGKVSVFKNEADRTIDAQISESRMCIVLTSIRGHDRLGAITG